MRYWKKTCAIALSATMVLGMMANVGITSCAAAKVEKEETVYVNQKADGEVETITVSDWLKNVTQNGEIKDVSNLKNIKNVKGDEIFKTGKNGEITWKGEGSDIYYQGSSDEKLPVGVKITYKLDNVVTKPADLAGKSGKLEITIQYENEEMYEEEIGGEKVKLNVPFLMASAMILPVDTFSNVTVNQGKLVSEGSNQILVAYGMPGLSESLDLSEDLKREMDEKLSDTVTICAKVKDFSMGSIYTIATSDEFTNIDLDDDSDIHDVEKAIDDLADATDELISGSSDLSDGLTTLKDSFKTYASGVGEVKKGASDLSDGATKLYKGVSQYTKGVTSLTTGTGQYVTGAKQLASGVTAYVEGEKQIDAGISSLNSKVGELAAYSEFNAGLQQYVNNVTNLASAVKGMSGLAGSVQTVSDKCTAAGQSLASAQMVSPTDIAALRTLASNSELTEDDRNVINRVLANVVSQQQAIAGAAGNLQTVSSAIPANISLPQSKDMDALITAGSTLTEKSSVINTGIQKLNDTKEGVPALYAGVKELSKNNEALVKGAQSLNTNGVTLTNGITTLNANTKTLNSSAKKLSTGAGKLSAGASKLNNSTKDVTDGIGKLQTGSVDLLSGMNQFKQEGTGKLQNEYNNNIKNVIERFQSMTTGADGYKTFTGIADGMDGSVKFIFQTAEIKNNK